MAISLLDILNRPSFQSVFYLPIIIKESLVVLYQPLPVLFELDESLYLVKRLLIHKGCWVQYFHAQIDQKNSVRTQNDPLGNFEDVKRKEEEVAEDREPEDQQQGGHYQKLRSVELDSWLVLDAKSETEFACINPRLDRDRTHEVDGWESDVFWGLFVEV